MKNKKTKKWNFLKSIWLRDKATDYCKETVLKQVGKFIEIVIIFLKIIE